MATAAKQRRPVFEIIKAVIVAVIFSLVAILLMALFIRIFNIGEGAINIINQVIKGISILFACLICLRIPKNGWVKGLIVGLLYIILAFVLFSILDNGNFNFGLNILNDIAIGGVSGMISGILAVAIRRKKE
ncbi:MAG: TIGR04086 family membrane protein [Firmicutes bacterium]|nr:TIGR04086 family membrane protein [Bacillota bacterium]MCL2255482.1 TIGR04086 family membrane protein [Bacillota bacterium]